MASRAQIRKYVVLGVVFAAWLVGDLWTKHWADTSLADPRHPLPFTAGEADAGRSVGDVVAERLGLSSAQGLQGRLTVLPEPVPMAPDDPMYGPDSPAPRARAFYVAWRGDELPPRRIAKNERRLLARWMTLAAPHASPERVRALVDGHVSGLTVHEWLQHHLRRLSDEDAAQVAAAGMSPIQGNLPAVDPSAPAEPGTTYLLEWRRIDVMGDWFKMVYAENPGAAFGFLKGVPEGLRDGIFFTLTVIVFLVILVILVRIPPRHRVVPVTLTGVLAGAVGNFVDRIRYGYVIDFIDMDLGFMHWPTYNVADIAISAGVVVLMLDITFNKQSPLVAQAPEQARTAAS